MTLSDLFIVCSHGRRSAHNYWLENAGKWSDEKWCPGGRPATLEDLGGEQIWWCDFENQRMEDSSWCLSRADRGHNQCGERILLHLPQMVAGESL